MHDQVALRRLNSLTFEQLRTFVAAVTAGSLSGAAEDLFLTQSAVSQRLRQMEGILGTPVFTRTPGQPVRLKFAGDLVLEYAREILRLLDELQDRVDGHVIGDTSASLTLALGSSASRHLLPRLLEEISIRHATIRISIREGTAEEIGELVVNGDAELGIQMDSRKHTDLMRVPFKMDRLGLCSPAGSRIDGSHAAIERLANQPFALSPAHGSMRQLIDQWAKACGVRISPVLETTNLEAMVEFVAHGLGLAFLPEFVVRDHVEAGRLEFSTVFGMPSALPLYLVYDARRELSPAAREVLTIVKATYWRHGDWSLDEFGSMPPMVLATLIPS